MDDLELENIMPAMMGLVIVGAFGTMITQQPGGGGGGGAVVDVMAYINSLMDAYNSAHAAMADGYSEVWVYIPPPPTTSEGEIPEGYPGTIGSYGLQTAESAYTFIPQVIKAVAVLGGLVANTSDVTFSHDKSTYPTGVVSMQYNGTTITGTYYNHSNGTFF